MYFYAFYRPTVCDRVRVLSFGQILLPKYLMNGLSNLDETKKY